MKRMRRIILGVLVTLLAAFPMSAIGDIAPPIVEFEKPVHYQDPKGEDVTVTPGIYRVEGIEKTLRLTPEAGGNPVLISAGVSQSTDIVEETVVEALPSGEDELMLILNHSNGQSWIARGSYSGIKTRGGIDAVAKACHPLLGGDPGSKACRKLIVQDRAERISKCLDSARNGPERKKVSLWGHEFNCKRASVQTRGAQTVITGQLSHHLSLRTDDQVYYMIVKQWDPARKQWMLVANPTVEFNQGGKIPLLGETLTLVGLALGAPIPGGAIQQTVEKLAALTVGSWRGAANNMVGLIAAQVP
jgi:hypothetical protein